MEKSCFESLTVFILASNETESLNNTVGAIRTLRYYEDISDIVIVVKSTDCPAYFQAVKIAESLDDNIEIYVQKSASLEQCIAELPELVKSSHFVITVADGEMQIENIDTFILKAKEKPERIVCAAKWHKDSTVQGYEKFHEFGSRLMNILVSVLFGKKVKDPFSIYQIFPVSIYNKLNYRNPKTFVYEYTTKALRNNVEYEEIPTFYKKRIEGKTNFNYIKLFQAAAFFGYTAVKVRFEPRTCNQKNKTVR